MGKSYWMKDQTGEFSNDKNDTFYPENNYAGIRLQQGKPLLDRDWNELEDIRRHQDMILRRYYIGDGTPDDGFRITIDKADKSKLKISQGRYLVGGFEAVNREPVDGPQLGGHEAGKYDLVYLDLWISEEKGPDNNKDVRMETCKRHQIKWEVKVIENLDMEKDFDYLTRDWEIVFKNLNVKKDYHCYSPLALMDRGYEKYPIVVDLRGFQNFPPIIYSTMIASYDPPLKISVGSKVEEIKITEETVLPRSPYKYIIHAKVTGGGDPSPMNPFTSRLRVIRKFLKYDGADLGDQIDSRVIDIKTEYKALAYNQYISELRPYRPARQIYIKNEGLNDIQIDSIGFISFY